MSEHRGDWILLEGMQFFGYHGVYRNERRKGQLFTVDVHLRVDLAAAGRSDDLTATVSYEQVFRAVRDIVEGHRFRLIEALAETLATHLLGNFDVHEVMVRVFKPQAPLPGIFRHVGVQVHRYATGAPRGGGELVEAAGTPAQAREHVVYLGLGSNLGDRLDHLVRAARGLRGSRVVLESVSGVYETEPWGPVEQPSFLNAVLRMRTTLSPQAVLQRALEVERSLGRVRGERWGPRTVDIDVLLYGNETVQSAPRLQIPHPRLLERAFVLVPLLDIDPDLVLPGGKTLQAALAALDTRGVNLQLSREGFLDRIGAIS